MKTLLFVDSRVQDSSILLQGLASQFRVVKLNLKERAAVQMARVLAESKGSAAVHVLCHGAPGCLYLGKDELSLATLERDAGAIAQWFKPGQNAEILLYGCNVAAGDAGEEFLEKLQGLTGAAIAASTTPMGCADQGGDWELDVVWGEVGSGVAIAPAAQAAYAGILAPNTVQVAVAYDGTASFDSDNLPGNDSANDNSIIRVHDSVGFDWFYNTTATGATNPEFRSILPEGMRWTGIPPQAITGSNIYDGAAYEADGSLVEGGDGRLMVVLLPDITSTTSAVISPIATVTGVSQGTVLDDIKVSFISDEISAPVVSTENISLTASAAPSTNIKLESTSFRGLVDNEDGSQRGAIYQVNISLLGDHPTRSGSDGVKGAAELENELTFNLNLDGFGDNARLFNFIPNGQTDIDRFGGDGATRNYERYNGVGTIYINSLPAGRIGEWSSALTPARATPDSGEWTASQSAAGEAISVTITGADTSGETFPSRDGANRATVTAAEKYFATGQVYVWIPIDDIRAGNDGDIAATDDNNQRSLTAIITDFDPLDAAETISNFGTGVEDASDNSKTFTAQAGVAPGVEALYRQAGNWGVPLTATDYYSGDAAAMVGQPLEHSVHLGRNTGLEVIENVVLAGMIDNTSQKVIPSTMAANQRPNNPAEGGAWEWSTLRKYDIDNSLEFLVHGVDYVVEFGTGGQGGDAGWDDWDEMDEATAEDADTSTIWTSDPTDVLLGGNADPETGVRDSITKYRFRLLNPLESGEYLWGSVGIEVTGPSSLETAGDNTDGITLAMFGAGTSDNHTVWANQTYDPATEIGSDGDRLTLSEAVVRVDMKVIETSPSGTTILAGTPARFQITGTVTAPLDSGAPAQDVYVTNLLPDGLFINDPSTVYPLVTDTQPVEFWDGTQWSTVFPSSGKAYGVRWYYGDEDLNTALPDMGYDAMIPFDAEDGTNYQNTVTISSPSDFTPDSAKTATAGIVAAQGAAINATEITSTPLIGQGDNISFTMQVANASETGSGSLDFVNILPYDGDPAGSSIRGTIDNITINNLPLGITVYVSSAPPSTIDNTDGALDGFADPGLPTDSGHIPEGSGIWQYTLNDVVNGVAGAPAIGDVTALRFVQDGTVSTILPAQTGLEWDIVLTPSGNAGLEDSDVYKNRFSGRVDNSILPLPVYSPTVTATVVEPELEVNLEVMQDPTGTDIDPTNDAHWGENLTAASGDDIYYRVQVTNTGTSNLQDINLTDFIPAGMTYVGSSASGDGDLVNFPTAWSADLAPGDTMTIVYAANGTFTSEDNIPQTVNASVTDSFGQSASDSDPAEYQPNLNPDATDDVFTTDEDTIVSGQVLDGSGGGTDTDPGNDPLTVVAVNGDTAAIGSQITLPSGALLTMNDNGTFDYDPNGQFEDITSPSTDRFTYQITDGDGGFDTATATITIAPINDAPSFGNLGGPLNITEGDAPTPLDVDAILADPELAQFDNWEGAVLTLERQGGANNRDIFTLPATGIGTATQNANGKVIFNFNSTADQASVDAFLQQIAYSNNSSNPLAIIDIAYTINDGNAADPNGAQGSGGDLEATGSVRVNLDRLPEAFDDAFNAVEDVLFTGNLLTDNGNGIDDLGDTDTTFSGPTTSDNGGTVSINPDGSFSYQPATDFVGTDTFIYTITDVDGDTSTATATFNVQRDTDADEIPDVIDLDDDNDGILDTTELGGLDPNLDSNTDGTPDWQDPVTSGFVDTNGDNIDDRLDPDLDGKPNHLDIDADNDGIPDNIEAQTTADYIAPSGVGSGITDVNQDGLDDNYEVTAGTSGFNPNGAGLAPVNSDNPATPSDVTPDYLDDDSDNDGTPDIQENGMGDTATPGDADGDGLLDVFEAENVNDGFDVNDSINNPSNSVLPDSDSDVSATGDNAVPLSIDLDYREDTPPVVDLDNDAATTDTADYRDTFVENGGPIGITDGNGTITDVDSTTFTNLKVTIAGVSDGALEVLRISGAVIPLNDSATPTTVAVGGTTYDVDFTGNDITFTLSGGGNIPEADAEALLNAIQYENLSQTPTSAGDRTFTVSTHDGNSTSNLATATIAVDGLPNAVSDTFSGPEDADITGNVFDDNGGGNPDDLGDTPGTTVAIATPTDQPSNGTVVINNNGTFTYRPNPEFNGTDSFTYTLTDADGDTSTAVVSLTIDPINDAPTVTGLADPTAYSENAAPVVLDGDALLADVDLDGFDNWDGATLTIERQAGPSTEDVFGGSGSLGGLTEGASLVVAGTGIGTVDRNADGTLELTFNNNATATLVDSVIQQITYQNTSDKPPASIALEYTISDGNDGNQGVNPAPDGTSTPLVATATKTVNITRENDKPILIAGDTLTYTENDTAQVVDSTVTLSDADDTEIASGTVTLSNGFTAGDLLAVDTTGTNITATYSPTTGVLTLSGTDTLANYQAVMQAVTYASSSDDPTATASTREVTWVVVDANSDGLGAATSDPVTSSITVIPVNDPPVLELDGDDSSGAADADYQTLFVPGNGGVAIADAADTRITDLDDRNIESATLTLTNRPNGTDESLSLTGAALTAANAAGITGVSYSPTTGVLSLTGSASLADYEAAIAAIAYNNVATIPDRSDRVLTVVVRDAGGDTAIQKSSNIATTTIRFDSDGDGIADTVDLDDDNDGITDIAELNGNPNRDTDGDGIIDSLDVDADNDGITDVIEAGGVDTDGDGRIDGFTDTDEDGLADSVDDVDSGSGSGEVTAGTPLATPNSDGTGNPDFQDIDADDDGIPDNVEAQSTDGYEPPAENDADGDGLDDQYDPDVAGSTPITTPENTDGIDAPDYRDDDSDNDGLTDLQENGDPDGLSNRDTDGDGLDDNFDDVPGPDVNDEIVDPATDLPDSDGIEDVNYRDREDTDSDNVPDPQDIDDDNDGILDTVELNGLDPNLDTDGDGTADWQDPDTTGFTDVNGDNIDDRFDADLDGKPNHLDIDADNDGIPDQVEAQTTASYIPPSGAAGGMTDTNGDGLDDAYGPGFTPVDTDSTISTADGIADYLDLDSDNDGLTDRQENGFGVTAPGTADTDGDGLLDDFEVSVNDGFVVNGRISDPNPTTLPDTDGDVAADGNDASPLTRDLDYRDNTAEVTIAANDPAASEPAGGNDGQFTVTLSQPSGVPTTVTYTITGDATNGTDYGNITGTVVIPAGATSVPIDITVLEDNVLEDDEPVTLTLTTVNNPNATINIGADNSDTVVITDDDVATLAIATVTNGTEPSTNGQFEVTLSQPSDTPTTVSYTVTGDATPDSNADPDYVQLSGTVTLPANQTSVFIDVTVINDILLEDDETVTVTLNGTLDSGDNNITVDTTPATVTIADDDQVNVQVVANDPIGVEGDNDGQYTIRISQPSDTDTVIEYVISGTATGGAPASGSDYDSTPFTSGQITIPANQTEVTLDVPVFDDMLSEPDETVVITLTNILSSDADIGIDPIQNEATVTILADTDGDNIPDVDDFDDDNDGILDEVEENGVPDRDTDGDGIPDTRDLDADNDGINDIVEAGHGADDLDNDGIVDGPVGSDGVPDAVQDDPNGETVNYTPLNSDSDPSPDFQDLDSDNDSLSDLYEGGSGGLDSSPEDAVVDGTDSDGDGILDAVDDAPGFGDANSPTPPNGDTDPLPDYRDLDSDGDGIDDIDEASNGDLDTDDDGRIDDPTDNDADGIPDVIDDSDLDGIPDADSTEGDPQEYGGLPLVDTDGDGLPDIEDLDDDNDGILDTVEELDDPERDTDGDGVLDRLDLDSDNDGINDLIESRHSGPDENVDGIVDGPVGTDGVPDALQDDPDSGEVNYGEPVDSDGDGQRDFQDLDSDNDSISDLSEGNSGGDDLDNNGVVDSPDLDEDGIQISVDGDPSFGDSNNPPLPNADGDNLPDYLDVDSNNDNVPDIIEAGNGILDGDGDGVIDNPIDADSDGILDVVDDSDGDGTPDLLDPDDPSFGGIPSPGPDADGDGIPNDRDLDDDNDGILDTVEQTTAPANGDTDGDGIPDRLDLDSDNDGINDVIEAGHGQADTDNDGMLDSPVGTDGVPDIVQDDPDRGTVNYGDPANSDSDNQPNFQDLDSDNDGLSDLLEGGALDNGGIDLDDNGVLDGPDTDGDGIQDSVDGTPEGYGDSDSPAPPNNDSDPDPDYIDLDSDNNGRNDVSPSLDGNGDGEIDDLIDNDNDGIVDIIDDSDSDGIFDPQDPGSQRFGGLPATDTDGDEVPDSRDLDDDNDGILDTDEGDGDLDTDSDGTPDSRDLDADNDGILDIEEAGHGAADSDGDGRIDGPAGDNGLPDAVETTPESDVPTSRPVDTDGDGVRDFQDLDADNDGINDVIEGGGRDSDGDGIVGSGPIVDVDEDGLLDIVDPSEGGTPSPVPDSDRDSIKDYRDLDSDNDGVFDVVEGGNGGLDTDGDGRINGADTDGDGILDPADPGAGFGDVGGNDLPDLNRDGVPDYQQPSNGSPSGSGGADTLDGGPGDDILNGLSDNDILSGGAGNDVINGGSDEDLVDGGTDNDVTNGGSDADTISAGEGTDIANGGSGNDNIEGNGGDDIANGGSGSDILDGGSGNDILDGGSGNDTLLGRDGNDILRGSRGDDRLVGGNGADILTGGQGNDVFAYGNASEFGDMILDFEIIRDRIDLSAIFNGNATLGVNVQAQAMGLHTVVMADAGAGLQQVAMLLNVNANTLDASNFTF